MAAADALNIAAADVDAAEAAVDVISSGLFFFSAAAAVAAADSAAN